MSKKYKIKREKRFYESPNFNLEEYTGLIVVSSFLPKENSVKKNLKINITNLYYYKKNFVLLDKHVDEKNILKFSKKYFNIDKEIINITNVYKRNKNIIYLVYIDCINKLNNYNKFTTLNIFDKKNLEKVYNNDLYQSIYNYYNYKYKSNNLKLFYDEENYISFGLHSIFYFMIGNYLR